MTVIIDTNVLIAANNRNAPQANISCVVKCGKQLRHIQQQGGLAIDNQWLIIQEYKNKVSEKGQPGVGDAFLKWVLTYQMNPRYCTRVKIIPTDDDNFLEFPQDEALEKFDRSDRKFVAVSLALKGDNRPTWPAS